MCGCIHFDVFDNKHLISVNHDMLILSVRRFTFLLSLQTSGSWFKKCTPFSFHLHSSKIKNNSRKFYHHQILGAQVCFKSNNVSNRTGMKRRSQTTEINIKLLACEPSGWAKLLHSYTHFRNVQRLEWKYVDRRREGDRLEMKNDFVNIACGV